ncbi:hypothetical protein ACWD4O_00655 [Streptomyces sp. NPDC002623]
MDKGGGAALVEVTEAGRFYLRHGRYPDEAEPADRGEPSVLAESPAPYSERPVARAWRAKARELVERLLAEGHVRFAHADDEEIAEWRRVINYAKRHGMEPVGKRIEKVPYGLLGLEFFLAEGPHPNARIQRPKAGASAVWAPIRLASLHPVVAALKDNARQLVMPPALRRRPLLMLQGLAAEAARRGHEVREVGSSYFPREGGVDVVVGGFEYPVTIRQEFPESTDPERSARLVVEVAHGLTGRSGRWRDRKSRTLEQSLGLVLGEIEARAVEDARRREIDWDHLAEAMALPDAMHRPTLRLPDSPGARPTPPHLKVPSCLHASCPSPPSPPPWTSTAAPSTASSLPATCLSSTSVPDQAGPASGSPRPASTSSSAAAPSYRQQSAADPGPSQARHLKQGVVPRTYAS